MPKQDKPSEKSTPSDGSLKAGSSKSSKVSSSSEKKDVKNKKGKSTPSVTSDDSRPGKVDSKDINKLSSNPSITTSEGIKSDNNPNNPKSSLSQKPVDVYNTDVSDRRVKIIKNAKPEPAQSIGPRKKCNMDRVERLARPSPRRLKSLWDEKCTILPPERRDKIKSALENDYFLSPEQTEQYFQALGGTGGPYWAGGTGATTAARKERMERDKELKQRQQWLINFSAQVAYQLCDYISKGQKEMLVSNRLRSIADVVLERVAEILGEAKPSRTQPSRLARFMVAISDRIAVWIENAVYRADAVENIESKSYIDDHMNIDADRPIYA